VVLMILVSARQSLASALDLHPPSLPREKSRKKRKKRREDKILTSLDKFLAIATANELISGGKCSSNNAGLTTTTTTAAAAAAASKKGKKKSLKIDTDRPDRRGATRMQQIDPRLPPPSPYEGESTCAGTTTRRSSARATA